MNKIRFLSGRYWIAYFMGALFIWVASVSAVSAQERRDFVDPAEYYEMVRVEVVQIDEEGVGLLRVNLHDCDGCTQEFVFSNDAVLESPLGNYQGLHKLSDWTDRDVLVVVGKQDGFVRRVTIN